MNPAGASVSVAVEIGGPTTEGRFWVAVISGARREGEPIPRTSRKTLFFLREAEAASYAHEQLMAAARIMDPRLAA